MSSWKHSYLYGCWSIASLLYYPRYYNATVCWKLYDWILVQQYVLAHSHTISWPFCNKGWASEQMVLDNQLSYSSNPKGQTCLSYQPPAKLSTWARSAHQGLNIDEDEMLWREGFRAGMWTQEADRLGSYCAWEKRKGTCRFSSVCAFSSLLSPWEQTCC